MADFVVDTFTDTASTALGSHTGETGATWTLHATRPASACVITSTNRVRGTTSAFGYYYASGSPSTAEYDVVADVRYFTDTDCSIGPAARIATGSQTAYFLRYSVEGSSTAWELYKEVSGSYTLLGSYTQALSTGTDYQAKLEIRDAAKKAYIDGVERISSADNAITAAGKAGIWASGGSGASDTGITLDNYTASDPASGSSVITPYYYENLLQGAGI